MILLNLKLNAQEFQYIPKYHSFDSLYYNRIFKGSADGNVQYLAIVNAITPDYTGPILTSSKNIYKTVMYNNNIKDSEKHLKFSKLVQSILLKQDTFLLNRNICIKDTQKIYRLALALPFIVEADTFKTVMIDTILERYFKKQKQPFRYLFLLDIIDDRTPYIFERLMDANYFFQCYDVPFNTYATKYEYLHYTRTEDREEWIYRQQLREHRKDSIEPK